jgi:subtilase family serine protease
MMTRQAMCEGRSGVTRWRRRMTVAAWFLVISIMTSLLGARPLLAWNLIDNGGVVLSNPKLYIVYWGTDWQNGFTDATSGLPSITYQAYLENFLNNVGGGSWLGTQLQYRNAGSQQGAVKGIWVDTTHPIPATPTQGQLEEEVRQAVTHFNNESEYPVAVYLIALPPGHGDTQFASNGGPACAWHSNAWNNNVIDIKFFPYINLPYMPDAGGSCFTNSVTKNSFDATGHGVFDGVSKVAGHEWAETLTDAFPGFQILFLAGWSDITGKETGDLCNGGPLNDIGAGGDYFAVQALWSNNDSGCVLGGVPTADQTPASYDFGGVVRYTFSAPHIVQLTNNGDLDLPLSKINISPWYLTGVNAKDFWLFNNTCGLILHPGTSCQVQVYFRPLDYGTRQAVLGVNIPLGLNNTGNVTPLTGDGLSQWAVFDHNLYVFGDAFIQPGIGVAPPPIPVSLANQGTTPRLIQSVELGGLHPSNFSIQSDGCSDHELGPLGSCTVVLGFAPTATGERQAELQFTDATGSVFSVPVSGSGLGPVAQLSTTELGFGELTYNNDGALPGAGVTGGEIPVTGDVQQSLTLTNIGQSPLQVSRAVVNGDYVLDSNDCTQSLQPDESCMIQVRLVPTHFQFQTGTLLIEDNTSDSPHTVNLTGVVDSPIAGLVPDQVRLGSVPVGSVSDPQTAFIENLEGGEPLEIQSIEATGDFSATSDCQPEILIGKCPITVTMNPTAAGVRNGMLVVTDNAPNSPQQIPLVGYGLTGGIDLLMTAVTPGAGTANQGGALVVTDTAENQGTATAGTFRIAYHLSPDPIYGNGDDVTISTIRTVTGPLAAGATNTATIRLSIPSTAPGGTYHLCAMADSLNQVAESDETNNARCSEETVTLPSADLVMTAVSTATTVIAPGQSLAAANSVTNQGGFAAGSFKIGFYLSVNSDGSTNDGAITATRTLSSLAAGASSSGTTGLTMSSTTAPGNYYLCAMADSLNQIPESAEGNNVLCTGGSLQVTLPDLTMTAVTPNAGTATKGGTLSVTTTASNGGSASGAFRIGFRLSPTASDDAPGAVVITITRSVTSLAAGASSTGTTSLTIPGATPSGEYYVCALADSLNQVAESNEGNNTLCSGATVTVQ